jgi:hypothetical protein
VGVAIFGIAAETTGRLLAEYQNCFTEDELVQLLELFVNYRDGRIDVSFDTERIVFEDQLQRIYTDHGAGRGSITADGLFAITELNKTGWKAVSWIIAPFFAHLAAHREEERALFNESIDAQVAVRKGEPWTWDPDAIQAVENNLQQRSSKEPYCVLACLLGSPVGVAIDSQQRVIMLRDATLTAIALSRFRKQRDRWPDDLQELAPSYMETLLPDRYDGLPLRYAICDGVPALTPSAEIWMTTEERRPKALPRPKVDLALARTRMRQTATGFYGRNCLATKVMIERRIAG